MTQALAKAGSDAHPRDYLNFFCPMKREVKRPNEPEPNKQAPPDSAQVPRCIPTQYLCTSAWHQDLLLRTMTPLRAGHSFEDAAQPDLRAREDTDGAGFGDTKPCTRRRPCRVAALTCICHQPHAGG